MRGVLFAPAGKEEYYWARYEHAWLLRAEGKTFAEIGWSLGMSRQRAQVCVEIFGRRMQRAIRKSRIAANKRRWAIAWESALEKYLSDHGN